MAVLLAGVRETAPADDRLPGNWVHLGVHVGGCWAHYRQNKHHRWFLDESQINQYHLAGALHPSVRWWEAMEVPRRSLQFLELSEGLPWSPSSARTWRAWTRSPNCSATSGPRWS